MAGHTRYLISRQSNRNLALDETDLTWFTDLTDADTYASRKARESRVPHYVHEVSVTPLRQHIPRITVESSDYPR